MVVNRLIEKYNSLGGRVKLAREAMHFTQDEVVEKLRAVGISISPAALSKLETGETKRVHTDLLLALAQVLAIGVEELLTGATNKPVIAADSEEALTVGSLMNAMLPRSRRTLTLIARELLAADQEQKRKDVRIAELLQDGISAMERRTADNGTATNGAQLPLPLPRPARLAARQPA